MWPVIGSVVAAVVIAISSYLGAKFARRREKADAAKIITDAAVLLIEPLKREVGILTARVDTVEKENLRLIERVATLEVDNRNLRSENSGLRTRIGTLERQLTDLGQVPANGTAHVITSVTETKTVTEQQ